MSEYIDPYATLGVLPNAESIVITAAYRALAQRYHPDKWPNDVDLAHKRMSAINEAYSKVGNPTSRKEFDQQQRSRKQANFSESDSDEPSRAFDSALSEMENRWKTASSIFPDLISLRQHLSQISNALAFSFVVYLLESRNFQIRAKVAEDLEKQFLVQYFGSNSQVLEYALKLILAKERVAARALNDLVEVMGSDIPAELVISRIDADFGLTQKWKQREDLATSAAKRRLLSSELQHYKDYSSAKNLCLAAGYEVGESGRGIFRQVEISIAKSSGMAQRFETKESFINWALANLNQPQ